MIEDTFSPHIDSKILDKIYKSEEEFGRFVCDEFDTIGRYVALKPQYSDYLFHDAYQSYIWDIDRLKENMKKDSKTMTPDHFKLCGYLAYWLRRNSPITRWDEVDGKSRHQMSKKEKQVREVIYDFGRAFSAFMVGYRICYFLEHNKESEESKLSRPIDESYIRAVCYCMQYKNVSPHALGLIYRSLFFV